MRYKESSERMSIPSVFQLKTLKDVEISVGNFTQCFSFNESDPSNIIPVKYFVYCICNISKHKIISVYLLFSRDLLLIWSLRGILLVLNFLAWKHVRLGSYSLVNV